MEMEINSLRDLPSVAQAFLEKFGDKRVFAFDGEMGAGKTNFISELLKAMGIHDIEGSPTYSLVNVYDSPMYGKIYHFDVYRLKNLTEAYDIGIEEMLYSDSKCFIEWPEKIEELLPNDTIWVYIRKKDKEKRTLTTDQ